MSTSKPWWLLEDPAPKLVPYVRALEAKQRSRVLMDYFFRAVYEGRPFRSVGSATRDFGQLMKRTQARLPSTRSAVDTIVNRLIKRRAMPVMTATDADWSLKTRARRLSRYIRSSLSSAQFEAMAPQLLFDAAVVGTGCLQVCEARAGVEFERVPREEIILEPRELRYNLPRQLHRKRRVSRWVLMAKFSDKASVRAIEAAEPADRSLDRSLGDTGSDEDDDQVDVWESWRLPSAHDAEDGRHVICLDGATLADEEWCQDVFPFAFLNWFQPASGFWGSGIVEASLPLQVAADRTLSAILENADAVSGLHVFIRRGSQVPKGHLGGAGPRAVEYDGAIPPQFVAPSPFNAAQFQLLQWLDSQVHEKAGASLAAAASKSPLGMNASGVALDNMMDIESDRFGEKELAYGHFRLSVAQCIIAVNKHAASNAGDEKRVISWDDKDVLRSIDWDKVDLERDQFSYRLEAANFLPETRAGKLSAIAELSKAGVFTDPNVIASLFDEPDLERANRLRNAGTDAIERMLEAAEDPDVDPPTPDVHLDLAQAQEMGKQYYRRLLANNAPEEVLSRVRDFVEMCKAIADRGATAAPPGPPAVDPMAGGLPPDPMAVPMAAPGAPPMGMPGGMPMPMPGGPQ